MIVPVEIPEYPSLTYALYEFGFVLDLNEILPQLKFP
jgi:hypothetical protein